MRRTLGYLGQTANSTIASTAPTPTIPAAVPLTSYTSSIDSLQSMASTKNWVAASSLIANLLADPNLKNLGGTLTEPLMYLQTAIIGFKDGDSAPVEVTNDLSNLAFLAQAEANANYNDRMSNKQLLLQRLLFLRQEVKEFIASTTKFQAAWDKLLGREEILFSPIQQDKDNLVLDIKTMPLTAEGRDTLLQRLAHLQQSALTAQAISSANSLKFITRALAFAIAGTLAYVILMTLIQRFIRTNLFAEIH